MFANRPLPFWLAGLAAGLVVMAACFPGGVLLSMQPTLELQPARQNQGRTVEVQDALIQYSLLSALASGDYAAAAPLQDVVKEADFGIGTFHHLEGEMILLEGKMYQALADGTVRLADLNSSTPFAAATFFEENGRIEEFAAVTLSHLEQQLDHLLSRRNMPYAIRVDGEFEQMTVRSVPAQSIPYRPLIEVVKDQPTWQFENVRGTLVGFRCPNWIGTLNVSGYHWHFLSEDRQQGGHVLACKFRDTLLRFDEKTSVVIRLPDSAGFHHFDTNTVNKQDIQKIERQQDEAE